MEQKNVSGFIILVRYLPMSFVHYYCLTIPTVILWVVQYKLFMKLKVIGHLPVVARPLDSQVTRPGSHPLDAQRQDSPITGPPHLQLTGPVDPQATAPSDPQGTGPLDLHLKMLVCVLEHCGSPAPAMSVNSAIESSRWARTGPELLALTLCFKNLAEDVEEAYQSLVAQSLVALPTGSKVLYRTFEFGPQAQDSEFEELRKLVLETMSTARILDPDCTLQLGSFAIWKYTDSGLRWWRLEKSWTPTISEVRQSPWNLLYTLSGFPRLWIVRGSNLRRATLKASTEDGIETLHILQHKVESNEDVLLCEEPRLIQASAIREKVYICASHSVEVQDGVTFGLQSEPINANKSSWILAMRRLIPSRWTMTMFLSLSLLLLGGVSYGIKFFILHLQHDDITVLGATLQRSSIPSYIFLLLHVLFYGVLFRYSRIFVQPSRVIVDAIPQPGRTRNLEETTSISSPAETPPPSVQKMVALLEQGSLKSVETQTSLSALRSPTKSGQWNGEEMSGDLSERRTRRLEAENQVMQLSSQLSILQKQVEDEVELHEKSKNDSQLEHTLDEKEQLSRQVSFFADEVRGLRENIDEIQRILHNEGRDLPVKENWAKDLHSKCADQSAQLEHLGKQVGMLGKYSKHHLQLRNDIDDKIDKEAKERQKVEAQLTDLSKALAITASTMEKEEEAVGEVIEHQKLLLVDQLKEAEKLRQGLQALFQLFLLALGIITLYSRVGEPFRPSLFPT